MPQQTERAAAAMQGPLGPFLAIVVQECANGQQRWDQVPAEGQSARGLNAPAPAIRLVAAAQPTTEPDPTQEAARCSSA